MRGSLSRFVMLVVLSTALMGCATFSGYPSRTTSAKEELKALKMYLGPEAITKYESPDDTVRFNMSREEWRNEVVNARIRAIDIQFHIFEQQLFQQGVGSGVATDWVVLAMNAAGTLASAGASNALNAASGVVVGGKAAFDKNAYFNKTMPALVAMMVAKRKEVLVRIREGLTKSTTKYPLNMALSDLDSYYVAGTIPGAIVGVAQAAGVTAENADVQLKQIIVGPVPADLQVRRALIAKFVKGLNQTRLNSLAQAIGVGTGANALRGILEQIALANSPQAVDRIAQQIKILFGKEF